MTTALSQYDLDMLRMSAEKMMLEKHGLVGVEAEKLQALLIMATEFRARPDGHEECRGNVARLEEELVMANDDRFNLEHEVRHLQDKVEAYELAEKQQKKALPLSAPATVAEALQEAAEAGGPLPAECPETRQ